MKRSEMERILRDHLDEVYGLLDDNDYEARIILTILESYGMLPPENGEEHVWHESGVGYTIPTYGWDDE